MQLSSYIFIFCLGLRHDCCLCALWHFYADPILTIHSSSSWLVCLFHLVMSCVSKTISWPGPLEIQNFGDLEISPVDLKWVINKMNQFDWKLTITHGSRGHETVCGRWVRCSPSMFLRKGRLFVAQKFPLICCQFINSWKTGYGRQGSTGKRLALFRELVAVQMMIQMEWITGNVTFEPAPLCAYWLDAILYSKRVTGVSYQLRRFSGSGLTPMRSERQRCCEDRNQLSCIC